MIKIACKYFFRDVHSVLELHEDANLRQSGNNYELQRRFSDGLGKTGDSYGLQREFLSDDNNFNTLIQNTTLFSSLHKENQSWAYIIKAVDDIRKGRVESQDLEKRVRYFRNALPVLNNALSKLSDDLSNGTQSDSLYIDESQVIKIAADLFIRECKMEIGEPYTPYPTLANLSNTQGQTPGELEESQQADLNRIYGWLKNFQQALDLRARIKIDQNRRILLNYLRNPKYYKNEVSIDLMRWIRDFDLSIKQNRFEDNSVLQDYANDVEILTAAGQAYVKNKLYLQACKAYSKAREFSFVRDKRYIDIEVKNIKKSYRYRMQFQLGFERGLNLNALVYCGIGTFCILGVVVGVLIKFHDEAGLIGTLFPGAALLIALWSPYWVKLLSNNNSSNVRQPIQNSST